MRLTGMFKTFEDLIWRFVPVTGLILMISYVLGAEVVSPHRRLVKVTVLMLILAIMYRFEMIFSLYLFLFLFPFPTGIALSSSNVILMTLIPLLWVVRAQAAGVPVWPKTQLDKWLLLFIGLHIVSFINVSSAQDLTESLRLMWRMITAVALFYMVVRFATDTSKLEGLSKMFAISAFLVGLTGIVEAVLPGATIIPGWISTTKELGSGGLGQRVQGLRIGGAVGSHSLLSDFSTLGMFFMGLHFLRAKNPITKTAWALMAASSLAVVLSTANRGAFVALVAGLAYVLWVFRARMTIARFVIVVSLFVAGVWVGDTVLSEYTAAVSILDRFLDTEFTGVVPETRTMTWKPALVESMNHIFIGHGPYFDARSGTINRLWWPHNAYIYYLYTVGAFGLGVFFVILYKLLRMSLAYIKPLARGEFIGSMMGVLHIQFIMFLIAQLRTDHQRTSDFVYMYIMYFLFGMIVATYQLIRKQAAENQALEGPE